MKAKKVKVKKKDKRTPCCMECFKTLQVVADSEGNALKVTCPKHGVIYNREGGEV